MTEKNAGPREPQNVYEAIVAVMQNVGYVQKVKTAGLNYSFASEADLIAALRPHMVAVGLTCRPVSQVLIADTEFTAKSGSIGRRILMAVTWEFVHAKSGSSAQVVTHGEGMDFGDKATNKAMTDSMKYALRQTFVMETGDDPDRTSSEEFVQEAAPPAEITWPLEYISAIGEHVPDDAPLKHVVNLLNLLADVSGWTPATATAEQFGQLAGKYRKERIAAEQDGDKIVPRIAAELAFANLQEAG